MRICFYYEYRSLIGGLTTLLLTFIKELQRRNVEVVLFNFKDGLIAKELEACGIDITIVDLSELNWSEIDKHVCSTDVFVISGFIEASRHFFKVNPKILFYNIDDYLADLSKYKFGINPRYLARKLVSELMRRKSLVLMDDTGVRRAAEKLRLEIENPLFLPIPVAVPATNMYLRMQAKTRNIVRLTYIGRSVDWKMLPLKKILDDLMARPDFKRAEIVFSIVVDNISNMKKFIDIEAYQAKGVCKIVVHENIRPSEISAFLLDNSDLNFAMGTSALESGKLGIPTILMDFSTKNMPADYRYLWLYHTKNFGLGRDVEKTYTPPVAGMDMLKLIAAISERKDYIAEQSTATYSYVKTHHSIEAIAAMLIKYAEAAQFHFRDVKPYILYYSAVHQQAKKLKDALYRWEA